MIERQPSQPNISKPTSPALNGSVLPRLQPRKPKSNAVNGVDPVPETPVLPPPPTTIGQFSIPQRRILSPHDAELFLKSPTRDLVQGWIFNLADSVRGKDVTSAKSIPHSATVESIKEVLKVIEDMLQDFPPLDTGSRFGNPIFRAYHKAVSNKLPELHKTTLGLRQDAVVEVSTYLQNSLGSEERIDYGSGHELNFSLWLLCLRQLGQIEDAMFPVLVLEVFPLYWDLMRKIQSLYYLEPAGSHGVWGLDDYQFLPFLFGASQLIGHAYITPKSIHNNVVLEEEADKYLYLNQVRWVDSVKTVKGLRWHSPMLDDISSAKSWQKIEDGMKKMFVKEILGKLPIMQHFLFGTLIPASKDMGHLDPESQRLQAERMKHVQEQGHEPDYWGDCCGIKVPSTVAAGEEMRKRLGTSGALRPIPFD